MNSTFVEKHFTSIVNENVTSDFTTAAITFVTILVVFFVFKLLIQKRLENLSKKTTTPWDDAIIEFLKKLNFVFAFFLSFYFGSNVLTLSPLIENIILYLCLIIFILYLIKASFASINFMVSYYIRKKDESEEEDSTIVEVLGLVIKIVFITIIIIAFLSIAGFNITSLLAGAGIAGIAIAFALQNILTDLFSSFTIFFDKPFKKGDFIIIGQDMGTIKKIGLKSTRVETLQGQELVVSNRELTSIRINNYKRMQKRRIAFEIGVEYSTPYSKLKNIPTMIKEIISSAKKTEFDRAHFKSYGDSSLNFEIVYYVQVPDYNAYMDVQQEINLSLFKKFEKEKINFAFPTRTIFMNEEKKEKKVKLLLFDVDGTLVNTKGHWNSMLKAIKDVTGKEVKRITGTGMCDLNIISKLTVKMNLNKEIIQKIIEQTSDNFKQTTHETKPLEGVVELLKELQKDHILGLITGNIEGVAWEKMKRANLKHFFKLGGFGNESKVRSDLIKSAIKKAKDYNIPETIVFGDSPNDIIAAKEANVKVIAVATGRQSKEELKEYNPDYLLDNLKNKEKILKIIS